MELKRYQERVVEEVDAYLQALERFKHERFPSQTAWEEVGAPGQYRGRKNGTGKDLPTFCIKVPTGGGKTLLATQILGLIHRSILKERNGTGLVLWVVPSDQIYKDTLRRLRDRRDFYREALEAAISRQIEVWEKHEIVRLTPGQLASNLNVLVLKLQGTNRQDKESLKFFRDSGGNIVAHFPPENEPEKHKELKQRISNLDMVENDEARGRHLVTTSVGNLVRLCEPAVVLDEGHKWTSQLARETVEGFNSSIVVELSATPPTEGENRANILVKITGKELLDEEMIKLPMNIANKNQRDWRDVVTAAKDRREELAKKAAAHYDATAQVIRPIVLVQVERTGKEQREAGYIHSDHVKDYLMQRLGVKEDAIAIKISGQDDLEERGDLLDVDCPVEWIITKAALQEGWDCPFAYILVALSESGSPRSMTQLVGRVLRQPHQKKTAFPELNECYIYCQKQSAQEISREVKRALEEEGYEGEAASPVDMSDGRKSITKKTAAIRKEFLVHYNKPFEGKIFLPRFCVKSDDGYEALDYYRHLLKEVDVRRFPYDEIDWDFTAELGKAQEQFWRLTLGEEMTAQGAKVLETFQSDDAVKAWMVANFDFYWFSAKQLQFVVAKICERLESVRGKLALVKFPVREKIEGFIQRHTDKMTEAVFYRLHKSRRLCFYLECMEGRFEIPREVELRLTNARLRHSDTDSDVERSLFDYVPDDLNSYEKDVALVMDRHPQVLWWYRNVVGEASFAVEGYRRQRIHPDFVVQKADPKTKQPVATVLVVESKGKQLKGNEDTNYKREVGKIFEEIGRRVSWQELGKSFQDETFRFQVLDEGEYADRDWHDDLQKFLED